MSNSTTGEWIEITASEYSPNKGDKCFLDHTGQLPSRQRVYMRPINAGQLAAEREKRMEEGAEFENISARAIQLQEQLAAERKKRKQETGQAVKRILDLEAQLAAEREILASARQVALDIATEQDRRRDKYEEQLAAEKEAKDRLLTQVADMTEQLDAERSKVQALVDLLLNCKRKVIMEWPDLASRIDAALAKIGEQ